MPTTAPLPHTAPPQAGGVIQLLAALLWVPQAALLAWAVQRIADGGGVAAVLPAAAGVALVGVLRAACDAWGMRLAFTAARRELSGLRAGAAAALAARGAQADPDAPASGEAASTLAEQAEAVLPWRVRFAPVRLRVIWVPPVLLLAVLWWSWAAALILLVAAPLIPLFMAIVGWRARSASDAQMAELGRMNGFLLDRLRGLPTLRALGAVGRTAQRVHAAAQDLRRRTMAVLRIAFLSSAVLELFSALGVAMVAVYVGFHLLGQIGFGAWGRTLSLGEGLFVLLLAPAFFEPLRDLAAVWHDRAAGEAAMNRLRQLAPAPTGGAHASLEAATALPPAGPLDVQVRGLRFAHPGRAGVFDGFALHVRPGEHVALVAASGGGKSTLLALLAGLLAPQAGEVRIGAAAMDAGSADALRRRIGWMDQRPHVFAGSLRDNVALGRPGVGAQDIDAALHLAGLGELAAARPAASLGEGGQGLSGGELVRLALARLAAQREAGLLLVDEPTAHLDGDTAAQVTEALLQLARGRTLIVATHDPALAARMHRVVRLDETGAQMEAA